MKVDIEKPIAVVSRHRADAYVVVAAMDTGYDLVIVNSWRNIPGTIGSAVGNWKSFIAQKIPTEAEYDYFLKKFNLDGNVFSKTDMYIVNTLYKEALKEVERQKRDYQARDH